MGAIISMGLIGKENIVRVNISSCFNECSCDYIIIYICGLSFFFISFYIRLRSSHDIHVWSVFSKDFNDCVEVLGRTMQGWPAFWGVSDPQFKGELEATGSILCKGPERSVHGQNCTGPCSQTQCNLIFHRLETVWFDAKMFSAMLDLGLLYMGKGLLTINPLFSDRHLAGLSSICPCRLLGWSSGLWFSDSAGSLCPALEEHHLGKEPLLAVPRGAGDATEMAHHSGRGSLRVLFPPWRQEMNELKVAVRVGQAVDVAQLRLINLQSS